MEGGSVAIDEMDRRFDSLPIIFRVQHFVHILQSFDEHQRLEIGAVPCIWTMSCLGYQSLHSLRSFGAKSPHERFFAMLHLGIPENHLRLRIHHRRRLRRHRHRRRRLPPAVAGQMLDDEEHARAFAFTLGAELFAAVDASGRRMPVERLDACTAARLFGASGLVAKFLQHRHVLLRFFSFVFDAVVQDRVMGDFGEGSLLLLLEGEGEEEEEEAKEQKI